MSLEDIMNVNDPNNQVSIVMPLAGLKSLIEALLSLELPFPALESKVTLVIGRLQELYEVAMAQGYTQEENFELTLTWNIALGLLMLLNLARLRSEAFAYLGPIIALLKSGISELHPNDILLLDLLLMKGE